MATYFILQDASTKAYAFKCRWEGGYRPVVRTLTQKEQRTATGKLDIQKGPADLTWEMRVKFSDTGSFSITPGSKVTLSTVYWGTYAEIMTLLTSGKRFAFRDFDGVEYYVYFTGKATLMPLSPDSAATGVNLDVLLTLRESVE
jgi:hypothetical protein